MNKKNNNYPTQLDIVKLYIGELMGLKIIGKKIHGDPRTFKHKITSLGIEVPFPGSIWCKVSQHLDKRFFKPLPKWKEEIVIGSLLGDAQIRLQSKVQHHVNSPDTAKYKEVLNQVRALEKKKQDLLGNVSTDPKIINIL